MCGEKSEMKQSHFSFYVLRNGSDLRLVLYLDSSARPSPAVPTGAKYRRGSARPPECSAWKSTNCGHDSIRRFEIFFKSLIKE